ncbi:unnamed protein product [Mytilus coruscus]|uniref:Uncharacterized protein n=1 Tax=Mytilus coruscus TaxID=42192 RepID=A0A6J8D452_MYTCO|nr:unnamed protein product [Mytilus coruscus]
MNTVRNNLMYDDEDVHITSGSFGEGLEMRGSDLDIMIISKTIEIHENMSTAVRDVSKTYLSTNFRETKPGFTYLSLEYSNAVDALSLCLENRGKLYLSSTLFKQRHAVQCYSLVHGPCLTDDMGATDFAYCLRSKSWVTQADQWITRPNNSWPTAEVKQNIVDHGVLFVPIDPTVKFMNIRAIRKKE